MPLDLKLNDSGRRQYWFVSNGSQRKQKNILFQTYILEIFFVPAIQAKMVEGIMSFSFRVIGHIKKSM
jgi:hypothetical protein